jgi:hypothetical protein
MTTAADSGRIFELPGPYRRVLRTLDRQRQKMLDAVEGYSPEWLTYSPTSDAWSILQPCEATLLRTVPLCWVASRGLPLPGAESLEIL